MKSDSLISEENNLENISEIKRNDYFQIDLMKFLMIFLVIMDHSFTHDYLHQFLSTFWERTSIPIFMIIMGFNLSNSYKGKYNEENPISIKNIYSKEYFKGKIKRYVVPYLLLYLVHIVIRLIVYFFIISTIEIHYYDEPIYRYLGYTFFYGPGLWFIPVIFGSIIIFPLLYWCFSKNMILTLIGTYLIEIMWHLLLYYFTDINQFQGNMFGLGNFFTSSIFWLFSAIGLGLWFSEYQSIKSEKNQFLILILPISVLYMLLWTLARVNIPILVGDYHLFFFPYSGAIFLLILEYTPKKVNIKIKNLIKKVSKSTYHIFLSQIFYFSIIYQFFLVFNDGNYANYDIFDANPINYLWFFPLNILITFSLGILWHDLEVKFYKKTETKKKIKNISQFLIFISAIAFFAWIIAQISFLIYIIL